MASPSTGALAENAEPQFIGTHGDSGKYKAYINQNDLRGHPVVNVQCFFNESTSEEISIEYTLENSGGDYFSINQNSGLVTLAMDALSFPIVGEYSAIVSCHVSETDSRVSTALIVTYTIENEYPPVFTHNDTIEVWIKEDHNVTEDPLVVMLNATDEDLGGCGQITYLISSGNKGGVFHMNSTSGVITLRSELDYEESSEYELTVVALNRHCQAVYARAMVTVHVHVININDEQPSFAQHVYNVSISENEEPRNFLKLSCSDPDTSPQDIVYVRQFQHKPFVVHHETGYISATRALDYEQQDSYVLTFACIDLSHPDRPRDVATVNIEVKPINEFRPVVKSPSGGHELIFLQEDAPIGTLVASGLPNTGALLNMRVIDRDKGEDGKVQFFPARRNNLTFFNQHFDLDATTGNLTLIRPIEINQCPENFVLSSNLVVLTACDIPGGSDHCPNIQIRIIVTPSECVPSFSQSSYEIEVNETEEAGTLLEVIPCELPTIVAEQRSKSIEIVSAGHNANSDFSVDENGALSLGNVLDYERRQNYSFQLRCFDSVGNEVFASVKIFVLPENDNRPYFDKALYIFNITNSISTTPYVVGTVQAKDKDLDYGNTLQYSIATISPVNFSITSQSGNIIIKNLPSSSSLQHDVFVFDVEATDGSFTATTSILILLNTDRKQNNCSSATPTADSTQLPQSSICGTGCYVLLGLVVAMILSAVVVAAIVVMRLCCLQCQIKKEDKSSGQKDVDSTDFATKYVLFLLHNRVPYTSRLTVV